MYIFIFKYISLHHRVWLLRTEHNTFWIFEVDSSMKDFLTSEIASGNIEHSLKFKSCPEKDLLCIVSFRAESITKKFMEKRYQIVACRRTEYSAPPLSHINRFTVTLQRPFSSLQRQSAEPVFLNLLRIPGIDSQSDGPVRQLYLSYRPAMLHR